MLPSALKTRVSAIHNSDSVCYDILKRGFLGEIAVQLLYEMRIRIDF